MRVAKSDSGYVQDDVGKLALSLSADGRLREENSQKNAAINIARRKPKKGIFFRCKVRQIDGQDKFVVVNGNNKILNHIVTVDRSSLHRKFKITNKKAADDVKLSGPKIQLYRTHSGQWYDLNREKRVSLWNVAERVAAQGGTLEVKQKSRWRRKNP